MNVPRLRFKEFGGDWEVKKLSDIFKITSGTTPLRANIKYFSNGKHSWVKTTDLNNGLITETSERVTDLALKETSLKILPEGTVLVAMYGGFNQIGRTGLLTKPASVNQALSAILPNYTLINPYYLLTFLNYKVDDWKSFAASSRKDPNITKKDVEDFRVNFPTLPEQTKIANFLTAVDEKIAQLTQKGDLLARYKKSVMQQIFSQQLRFKPALCEVEGDDDGRDFPDWEERELKNIAQINPKKASLPDEFIYIDLESVEKGFLLKETTISKDDAPSRAQRVLKKEDVLFQMVRPYQRNNLFFNRTGDYVASTGYAQIRAYENARYLYHFLHLNDFIAEVMNRCTGTSYPAINSNDLATISIQVPVKEEQTKIANFLTALDDKITYNQTQLSALKHYKQGLLQQMFV